ncbi:hypothetical protein [Mucilaginibacter sp. FT3.2]|uniref:hypothetical protein n=1 Tax=Mucilaginibacter sp. FT3.2 TaxID=2723090 RepID=UPI00161FD4A2|nr:hypothetical protein [Mucilaginibacter sp. FT3.2]MBB6231874.1 hypothetical protein [Mucilaginibacter sp. FT3.2]
MNEQNINPGYDDDDALADNMNDRDRTLRDDLDETMAKEDLNYNAEDDSFEYDVKSDDPDYYHPDPYKTSVKNGEDMNSTYDEANPYDAADGEYSSKRSIETDVDDLAMHIDDGEITEVDAADAALAHTPEDDRDDLDEEGYPKNDTPLR